MSNQIEIATGCMSYDFITNFLEPTNKKTAKLLKQFWTEGEDFIEYKVFAIENKRDDKRVEYSECWFIVSETEMDFLPFVVTEINSSSKYAMFRCGMDSEDEEEEIETFGSVEEIVEKYCDKKFKRELIDYLNHLKTSKKIIPSPLDNEPKCCDNCEQLTTEEPWINYEGTECLYCKDCNIIRGSRFEKAPCRCETNKCCLETRKKIEILNNRMKELADRVNALQRKLNA